MYSGMKHLIHLKYIAKLFVINENVVEANIIQFVKKILKIKVIPEQLTIWDLNETNNILSTTKATRTTESNAIILAKGMGKFYALCLTNF
jgi:hypothetical protein